MNNLLYVMAAQESATKTEDEALLFCDIFSVPFLFSYLFLMASWSFLIFICFKINEKAGVVCAILVFLAYIVAMVDEFKEGHILHGLTALFILLTLIIIAAIKIITIYKKFQQDEAIRAIEIPQIPQRVENFISANGYCSTKDFIDYSDNNNEFHNAHTVRYSNPLYIKQVNTNKERKKNKLEPLPITEPQWISYGNFASFKYKEIVLTYFMKELSNVIKNIYMFDYENLYDEMESFKSFYIQDDGSVDMVYFKQACIGIIMQSIAEGLIETVGESASLFRSKVIPEDEGNVVEGETLEL